MCRGEGGAATGSTNPRDQLDVGSLVGADSTRVTLERADEEIADQPPSLRAVLRLGEGPVEAGRVPTGRAPLLRLGVGRREKGDELSSPTCWRSWAASAIRLSSR